MATRILIPTPLRPFTGGNAALTVDGSTVGELLSSLTEQHPAVKTHLYTDEGRLRSFVNVYVNEEDIRFLKNKDTSLKDGDEISIIPAIAGG